MIGESLELGKRDVIGLLVAAYLGAILVAGIGSGLLLRAGVDPRYAFAGASLACVLLLYPILRTIAVLRGKTPPSFVRWASVWTITLVVGFIFLYPLVARGIDKLIP